MTIHHIHPKLLFLALLSALPLVAAQPAPAPVPASDAAFRITGQTVITKPGYYKVMNDFSVEKGMAILINADNVTVDLDDHSVTGNPENSTVVISDPGQVGLDNIHVTNGTLIGGHHGIEFLEKGVGVRKRVRVDHVKVIDAHSVGIDITGSHSGPAISLVHAVVENNVIYHRSGACGFGILLAYSSGSRVKNNVVTGCQRGLELNEVENSVITGNILTENSYAGIVANQSRFNEITGNQISSSGSYAITLNGSNNVIERNVFMNTQGTGLSIQPGPTFASIGNIHAQNRGNCANCYDITEGNIDAGGNLPAPVALPPIMTPTPKTRRRQK